MSAQRPAHIESLRAWLCLSCVASSMLAGCATAPLPDLAMPLPSQWGAGTTVAAPAPDLHSWWRRFADPELDGLIDQALVQNLDVATAVERLRAARALYGSPDAPFRPSLHARTDDPVDPDASASFFVAGFDSVWELGLFGRRQAKARAGQGQIDAAIASLREARVSLTAEVVRNWIDLRAAQQRIRLLTRIRDQRRHSLQLLDLRAGLHLAAPEQVAQAQAAAAVAEGALSEPRQAVNAASRRLALLLGHAEPDPAWLQTDRLPKVGSATLSMVPADLLRTRPEIARAQADVLRAAGELGIAHADLYPRIALGGSIEWSTKALSHRRAPANRIAAFGPIIDIPLFDWGLRQARVHAEDHLLKASVLGYRKAVMTGVAEVETSLGNLAEQRQREAASAQAWDALKRVAHGQVTRQHLGLADGMAVADAAIARDQAGIAMLDARAAHDLAYVALYKALGGAPAPNHRIAASPGPGDDD
ncbi:MAG: efflux transporter outer membrane subunit [Rhodanobacteraceae bacterium]